MENTNRGLQEALLQSKCEPLTQQELIFTVENGVKRCVSRRDERISCTPEWILGEVRIQLCIAGPMVCVSMLQYLLIVVSVMFVGHLGELQLASAAIASSFASVTGSSLHQGMASVLETFCGQSYGAKQYHMLGIPMQRAVLVLWLVSVPIAVLWWNMNSLLLYLGQDPEISEMAGEYARCLVPTLFGLATLQPLIKFLQTQSVVLPMALSSAATLSVHVPLCWMLLFTLGFGHRSAAIAISISTWLNVVLLGFYVKYSSACKRTWISFSREAFHELSTFCELAIPSAVMICLQYWLFEVLTLLSGLLPNPQLETSTLSICLTSNTLLYMIPFGIGASASTRVGNELGAGRPQAAKAAVILSASLGIIEGLLIATLMCTWRNELGKAFTVEQEVVSYVARCTPLLAIIHLMDSIQGVLSGVSRGCGRQAIGAAANLGSYYIVGLPTAIILAFVYGLNGRGLWLGMVGGIVSQSILLVILTILTDWQQQADRAFQRVFSSVAGVRPKRENREQLYEPPAPHSVEDDDSDHHEQ